MSEKIKVLHAITRLDRGGSSENTLLSAAGLAEKGYKVDILFGRTEDVSVELLKRAREAGVDFIEEDDLVREIHPLKDIVAFFDILRFLRDKKYDIVHTHSSKAGLICRFAARLAGASKIVYTPHGHVFYGYFSSALTNVIIFIESLTARVTDRIIGLTPAECDEWISFGIGQRENYISIPSGMDFELMENSVFEGRDLKEELGIPPEHKLIGSIGRFVEVKGYEYFIKAASELVNKRDDVHFVLAGDGPLLRKYKKMIESGGLDGRFHMIGWQEHTAAVLKALDIFVLSSLNEGMGRVLVMAMYYGKPVIATRVGGVPSIVSGEAGILIEPASAGAITRAVESLLEHPEKTKKIAQKGREIALSGYSAEKMVNDLDKLYKELLGEK
ncbi:MAG: glycosyltransferase family 4 protein [Candidatus Omnitrophota bacterium]|nr:glycosyltransferase family 4 protein [Candidatus Omnitrophota bacterium]